MIETQVPPGLRSRNGKWFLVTTMPIEGERPEIWIPIDPADLFEQLYSKAIASRLRGVAPQKGHS